MDPSKDISVETCCVNCGPILLFLERKSGGGRGPTGASWPCPPGAATTAWPSWVHFLFVGGRRGGAFHGEDVCSEDRLSVRPPGEPLDRDSLHEGVQGTLCPGGSGPVPVRCGGRNELRQVLPTVERYCPRRNKVDLRPVL
ncbi:unnamed protein product [Coregonus sp. 'balchen']|nr:unnamed protein product [Coregonus sp. 'balchen']